MKFSKKYLRYSLIHPRSLAHQEILKIIKAEGCNLKGLLVDVGCGKKPYRDCLPNINQYIGLDVPVTMHGLTYVDVAGTTLFLPFANKSVDSILCTEVLEHTPDPLHALKELNRVARSGGTLLLTVPFSEQLHEEPYDFYRFTPHSIKYLLEKSGWKIQRFYRRGGAWLEMGYRLSSLFYSSIGASQNSDGSLRPRLLLAPFVILGCLFIQLLALIMDFLFPSSLSTIGFGVFAVKDCGK